jgi:transposase-like protein
MATAARSHRRYSVSFQRMVIQQIESGKLSITQARRLYDIGGHRTIQRWLQKHGKGHLLSQEVAITMNTDLQKLTHLERQKQELERALGQAHLKILYLESLLQAHHELQQQDGELEVIDTAEPLSPLPSRLPGDAPEALRRTKKK